MGQKKQSTFKVKPKDLAQFIRDTVHEGNVRRIVIKDLKGKPYVEIPVTVGVIGTLAAPTLMAATLVLAMLEIVEVEIIRKN